MLHITGAFIIAVSVTLLPSKCNNLAWTRRQSEYTTKIIETFRPPISTAGARAMKLLGMDSDFRIIQLFLRFAEKMK